MSITSKWGARTRIGLIELSTSVALTGEVCEALPPEIGTVMTRIRLPGGAASLPAIKAMVETNRLEEAAAELADAQVAVVVFACTIGSLLGGPGFDQELVRRLEKASRLPATTTSTALLRALQEVGASTVGVGTPYIEELNDREASFLADSGFSVTALRGLGVEADRDIAEVGYEVVKDLARSVADQADVVFLSCTNMSTLSILEELERELGRPVFSSNAVTLWHALRLAGEDPRLPGLGALLGGRLPMDRAMPGGSFHAEGEVTT